jgi:hypothetical protein
MIDVTRSRPMTQTPVVIADGGSERLDPGLSHVDQFAPGMTQLAPEGLSKADQYAYYAKIVTEHGGTVESNEPTVLGLRGLAPDGVRHDSAENIGPYNDTFIVLKPGAEPEVTVLPGQTHSGQKSGPSAGGVAQIEPGNYEAQPHGPHHDMPSWHVIGTDGSGNIPCWRDANMNGYIDPSEKAAPTVATAILFHTGVFEDHGSSIGCQVMAPEVHQEFIQLIGETSDFHYTLVDANTPQAE